MKTYNGYTKKKVSLKFLLMIGFSELTLNDLINLVIFFILSHINFFKMQP